MSLVELTAGQQLAGLAAHEFSSEELVRAHLQRIDELDEDLGAFLSTRPEQALDAARKSDGRRGGGEPVGRLEGVPIALKDILCTAGELTTCASRVMSNFRPPYSATVIERLESAGAIVIGKTNLDEFAMGSSTENSSRHVTRNPWNRQHAPGGSSGGSTACVSAAMVPWSLGTDTGGSIRQPAAFCGVVGVKPTYGRVSRYGLVAFASSLDQIGPIARTAEDAALLLEVIAGHDPRDSTSAPVEVPSYSRLLDQPMTGMRVGVVREHLGDGLDAEVRTAVDAAVDVFRELGAEISEVSLPHSSYGIATYYIIAPCEASSNLARYDGVHYGIRADEKAMLAELARERREIEAAGGDAGEVDTPLVRMFRQTRTEGFGAEVQRRIMIGTYALSAGYYDAYYLKAMRVRRLIRHDYDRAFESVDLLIGPTTPTPAFRIGEKVDDPLSMYLEDLYTVSANLAGVAGVSLPCGVTAAGLPIGLQLQAAPFDEARMLAAAHQFQSATDWHQRRPPL